MKAGTFLTGIASATGVSPATATGEESSYIATKSTEIETYAKEGILKFIMGQSSMDDYDAFVANLKKMGINDVLKKYQAAYDRYMSK